MANQYTNRVDINGQTILDLTSDTATIADVRSGKTFHLASGKPATGTASVGGVVISDETAPSGGTIRTITSTETYQSKTSDDISVSGASITVPAGYYNTSTTKSVASGSAGTPSATKGSVSNHSVSITPSVTNATGYINGGTKTGNAVTVTASELVSGNKEITANGTNIDVTNYSTVSVNVSGGGDTGKNIQVYAGYDDVASSSYVNTDVTITVSKAGTYKCSWIGWKSTSSGTSGSQLYKNGVAVGTAHTTFTRTYGQFCQETLTLARNDVLVVRARSRNTSYYMAVGNLIIEEQ